MIIKMLKTKADMLPNKIALSDTVNTISYCDLYKTVTKKANALLTPNEADPHLYANSNSPVVILIDRNIESIICFLSVAVTGNFYVPVDITQPVQRMSLIIETLKPSMLINATNKPLPMLELLTLPMVNYTDLISNETDEQLLLNIEKKTIDTDPLYAMFTSGSTGVPKGALISRRSIYDLVKQFNQEFQFDESDIFGNQAPFDFDVSVKDLYNALYVGATIVIIPKVNFSFPAKLVDFLNTYKISIGIWSVSVLRIVENLKGFKNDVPQYMRQIMFSGEVMSNKTLNYWRSHLPATTFVNLYGPTEITCNCSFYIVDRPFNDDDSLPIGIPFENTRIILLDENNQLINKPNMQGELCVIGSSLALGYYNNPDTTAKAFVDNPLNTMYEEKIYRTGDLAFYNEEGLLMFVSRIDQQIKHMGHRIELGEIEKNANALAMIEASACIYDKNAEKIVMFYQSEKEQNKDIYICMLEVLPKYMVPNRMIHFDKLPLNKNGKIDRVLLTKDYYNEKN